MNELQNIESTDQAKTPQDHNHEEMEIDGTPEIDTAENELNESMHNSNEDVTQQNDTHENDNIQCQGDQNNILEQITSNLLSGQQSMKWKKMKLTPEMLFIDVLNNATFKN